MTTPDPITTAREAVNRACRVPQQYPSRDDLFALQAVIDLAKKLQAAKWDVKHVDTMNDMVAMGLAKDAAVAEIEKLKAERDDAQLGLEAWRGKAVDARTKNRELTSQLEQAEKVIAPFVEALRIADVSGQPIGYHIGIEPCQVASQWIKDRQAKGEG